MTHLVVADWDDVTKRVTAEARAYSEAEADAKVVSMGADGYANAFHVLLPSGAPAFWVVDPVAETVSYDQASNDADTLKRNLATLRTERNTKLTSSDWTQAADSPLTDEVKATWATYRQELRDLPASTEDPADPTWPSPPE